MTYARLVLATVLLLASASVAAAECAWVLWEKADSKTPQRHLITWTIHHAHEVREDCEKEKSREWSSMLKVFEMAMEADPTSTVKKTADGLVTRIGLKGGGFSTTFFDYTCLPDTIDPREPKP